MEWLTYPFLFQDTALGSVLLTGGILMPTELKSCVLCLAEGNTSLLCEPLQHFLHKSLWFFPVVFCSLWPESQNNIDQRDYVPPSGRQDFCLPTSHSPFGKLIYSPHNWCLPNTLVGYLGGDYHQWKWWGRWPHRPMLEDEGLWIQTQMVGHVRWGY